MEGWQALFAALASLFFLLRRGTVQVAGRRSPCEAEEVGGLALVRVATGDRIVAATGLAGSARGASCTNFPACNSKRAR